MSIQQDVLNKAASRIGYVASNDPNPGSEAGRYWANKGQGAWLAGPSRSIWWCMLFVSMVLDQCGQINAIGGFSYNTDVALNRNRGRLVSVGNAQPGDIVIFNWNGGGTDHVGFVERNLGRGVLQTIEGNTSSGAVGSQSAGNGVWRRRRSACIAAVIRPAYTGNSSSSQRVDEDGYWGPGLTTWLQNFEGTNPDGIISGQARNKYTTPISAIQFGPGGSDVVNKMSQRMGITDLPRQIGPDFIGRILIHHNGGIGNGILDRPSDAIRRMQEKINREGTWW